MLTPDGDRVKAVSHPQKNLRETPSDCLKSGELLQSGAFGG